SLRSAGHLAPIQPHIRACLMIFVKCLLRQTKQKYAGIKKDASVSMRKVAVVKHVAAMELLKLKCIFYRTFMYRVKYATASGIIEKHERSNIKVKTLSMCWKCAWKKHWTFLAISRKSSENCRRLPMLVWDILNSASLRRLCQEGKRNVLSLRVN